jgi:glutamine amidotransferase
MICIIDYGMGNLGSVFNMLKKINAQSCISQTVDDIRKAEKLILPGVGAFDSAIKRFDELGIREAIEEFVMDQKKPLLGICLGMQLLMECSEEGILHGLGFIKGKAYHFRKYLGPNFRIPHMGWNAVQSSNNSPLTNDLPSDCKFYFVHSYFVSVENESNSILKCSYGIEFDAGIQHNNIFGVQFHPEKSHNYGMKLLSNFASL